MTADQWAAAFQEMELPESAKIDKGVIITDVQDFMQKSLYILRSGQQACVTAPIELRLKKLLEVTQKLQ